MSTARVRVRGLGSSENPAGGGLGRFVLPAAVFVALVVVALGWLLLIAPVRDEAASVDAQAQTVATQADTLQSRVAALKTQQAQLPRYRSELEAAQAALPSTTALPAFLRSLQDLGTTTGTDVTAMTASVPDSASATGTTTGVGQVYTVPLTVTVTGGYDGLTAFVAGLQDEQPRAVLVDSFSTSAGEGGATTLTLTLSAFVAPTAGS